MKSEMLLNFRVMFVMAASHHSLAGSCM